MAAWWRNGKHEAEEYRAKTVGVKMYMIMYKGEQRTHFLHMMGEWEQAGGN